MHRWMDGCQVTEVPVRASGHHTAGGTSVGCGSRLVGVKWGHWKLWVPFLLGHREGWLDAIQGDQGLERTGWVGMVSTCSLPGPSGRYGSCRGFSVKRQKDFMNISLGKQCGGRGTSGGTLQGAGSPRRKQGCEIRRWYEGLWASTTEGSSLPVTTWLGSSTPVLGIKTCHGGGCGQGCEGGSWVSSLVPLHHVSPAPWLLLPTLPI